MSSLIISKHASLLILKVLFGIHQPLFIPLLCLSFCDHALGFSHTTLFAMFWLAETAWVIGSLVTRWYSVVTWWKSWSSCKNTHSNNALNFQWALVPSSVCTSSFRPQSSGRPQVMQVATDMINEQWGEIQTFSSTCLLKASHSVSLWGSQLIIAASYQWLDLCANLSIIVLANAAK